MKTQQTARRRNAAWAAFAAGICTLGMMFVTVPAAHAQRTAPGTVGETRINDSAPINAARDVNWEQKLDGQVTLAAPFRDENDRPVQLSQFFGRKRPVMLVMPFYKCPGICTAELNGIVDTLKDQNVKFRAGRDFDIVTISINPRERGELATMKKKEYMDILGQPGAEAGWHFLTGEEQNIRRLADEIGFRYKYDPKTDQYAHPGGIVLLTPEGKISRYFFGVAFPAKDVRLALTEAGQGHIGSVADKFVLACYHYDPQTGRYGPAVFKLLQVAGFSTVFALGSFMLISFRKDARESGPNRSDVAAAGSDPKGEGAGRKKVE